MALVKWRLAGMLPREWKMCIHCVAGKPESDDRGNYVPRLETKY